MCTPSLFDEVVAVTKAMGGFEATTEVPSFAVPSTPRLVGHALGKVVHFLRGRAIRDGDVESESAVNSFARLLEAKWGDRISRASLQTLNDRKQKQDDAIPSTEDMKRLTSYLRSQVQKGLEKLRSEELNIKTYNKLVVDTMLSLLVFNKRRGGETARVKLTDFTERVSYTQNETIMTIIVFGFWCFCFRLAFQGC